eukprot:SAG31_NODE_887_length_11220_cov_9.210233_6_plen_263_part_00
MTALDWYRDWYPKIADGWGQQTSDGTKTHELYECYQEEGDVVYGPGGWMHVVVSIKDSLVLSEQMMFPSDLPGAVPVAALDQLHLLEAGLCDINVVELQLTSYAQLRVVRLLMQQRTEPSDLAQLPSISRGDRVKIVVNILRFCAGCAIQTHSLSSTVDRDPADSVQHTCADCTKSTNLCGKLTRNAINSSKLAGDSRKLRWVGSRVSLGIRQSRMGAAARGRRWVTRAAGEREARKGKQMSCDGRIGLRPFGRYSHKDKLI